MLVCLNSITNWCF